MRKILKIFLGILIILYILLIVFVAVFSLSKNEYGVSNILGKNILLSEESLEPNFKLNTFIMITPSKYDGIEVGEKIFFYDTYSADKRVSYSEVTKKEVVNEESATYRLKDSNPIDSQFVLGNEKNSVILPIFGQILSFLQTRFGFLFMIIFPLALGLIIEVYSIIKEIRNR
jgi:hypothetical protein